MAERLIKNHQSETNQSFYIFKQSKMPIMTTDGKILLEAKNKVATSPNGNGGWFVSMKNAGLLEVVKKEGIEWLNIFAVDNVLQRIADPCFSKSNC